MSEQRKPFSERFKEIIYSFVGKHEKKFKNTRELSKVANVCHSNISNFITGRTKSPDNNVLRNLSMALGYPNDYFSQLYLFCEGITKIDPEKMLTGSGGKIMKKEYSGTRINLTPRGMLALTKDNKQTLQSRVSKLEQNVVDLRQSVLALKEMIKNLKGKK